MEKQADRIIHLDDMLLYILEQWKILIAGIIIIGIVFGGMGMVIVNKKYKTASEMNNDAVKEISVSGSDLINVDMILYLEKAIKNQKEYNANSILMKINPFEKRVASIRYQFQVTEDIDPELNEDKLAQGVKAYQNVLRSKEICDYIKKLSLIEDDNNEVRYLKELISLEIDIQGTVTVNVCAPDEQLAQDLKEAIKDYLDDKCEKVLGKYSNLTVKIDSESVITVVDIGLHNQQTAQYNNMQNLRSMLEARRLDLSDEAKQYLALAKKVSKEGNYKSGQPLHAEIDHQDTGVSGKLYEAGIYAFKRVVLFACLFIVWFGLRYMWSTKLMYAYDLREMNGIRVVEVLSDLDANMICVLAEKITVCLADGSNDVLFISSDMARINISILESLKTALIKKGISVECLSGMDDAKMLNCVKDSKNIIIVESIGQSKYSRIKKCIDNIYCFNKEIAGALVIKLDKR